MPKEKVFWSLFGRKLLSYRITAEGGLAGTGLLNFIVDRFRFFLMLILEAGFYRKYAELGRWHGKRVANPFAPPVGSRPQFRALASLARKELLGRPSPIAMTFAVTYDCPCHCVHCSAGHHRRNGERPLSTSEAKSLIDESQNLGVTVIAFTGGEPLLRPDICELVAHVDQRKAMPIMFTNGLLLTDENVDRLAEAGLYTLFVSIDSPIAEEHDSLRGMPGLFDTAVAGLKRMKERGVFVGLSSYATRTATGKGMYRQVYALAQELGVHDVILFDAVPTGNLLKDESELLTPEQREEIMEFSEAIFRESEMPPFCSQSWQNSVEGYLSGIGCLAGNVQYYVSAYGEVTPCDFTPLSFGSIRKEPLKEIWSRMISHPAYEHRTCHCRMQDSAFRRCYIDPIPAGTVLPYPIDRLPALDYRRVQPERVPLPD
jgi:MoaA/NifB/PqqE/SkfB family radical SAM enzyme